MIYEFNRANAQKERQEMKVKKLAMILALLMVAVVLVGCTKEETPKQVIKEDVITAAPQKEATDVPEPEKTEANESKEEGATVPNTEDAIPEPSNIGDKEETEATAYTDDELREKIVGKWKWELFSWVI